MATTTLTPVRPRADREHGERLNVGRAERLLCMIAGGALAAYGLRRRENRGATAAIAAAGLLLRGGTGFCPVYGALGVNTASSRGLATGTRSDTRRRLGGARGVHVEESVTINRPLSELYAFWREFQNLPQFMSHLHEVETRADGTTRWVAKAPLGMTVEWDARIINDIPDKVIGWQSLEGAAVATAGSVTFASTPRGTIIRVHFQYDPPAGKLGAALAWVFGEDPSLQVREDLRRLKQLMEAGEIATTTGQPRGSAR
jgi:uncharacterized membrane protein